MSKKQQKKLKDTRFGAFAKKAYDKLKDNVPDIAESILTVALSPNPVGAVISETRDLVSKSGDPDLKAEFEMNAKEFELELHRMDTQDRADARDMYKEKSEMADYVAKKVILWNLPAVFLLVGVLIGANYLVTGAILSALSALVGYIIRDLLSERQTLMNFLFGSSLGSKQKDKSLEGSFDSLKRQQKF